MQWMMAHRNAGAVAAVSVISDCFGPVAVGIWTAVAAMMLVVRDRHATRALTVIAGVVVAGLITEFIKVVVARPRPPIVFHPTTLETSYSYPSGHVAGTCALALTAAVVCTTTAAPWIRRWALTAALVLTVGVAGTRMYLGVHWFSDVVAAVAVGVAVVLVIPQLVEAALTEWGRRHPEHVPGWLMPRPPSTNRVHEHVHR